MESIPSIVPIPVPFCNLGSKDEIKYSDAETKPSLSSGFGAKFEKPESGGGTYVTRQQMNGILYLATAGECARQNGAINTFNPDLVATTGGYAEGAVLDALVGGTVRKVRSLHNNNTFDFTKSGINGIDWEYCDSAAGAMKIFPSLTDAQTLCDGYNHSVVRQGAHLGDIQAHGGRGLLRLVWHCRWCYFGGKRPRHRLCHPQQGRVWLHGGLGVHSVWDVDDERLRADRSGVRISVSSRRKRTCGCRPCGKPCHTFRKQYLAYAQGVSSYLLTVESRESLCYNIFIQTIMEHASV